MISVLKTRDTLPLLVIYGFLTLFFVHVSVTNSSADSNARTKRAEKRAIEAKKLKDKMQRSYGGSCGTGTEIAGGFPPEARGMYCRYPTTKGPVKHGKFFKWWPDGSVRMQGEFWQGKKHGTWISFLPNGRKKKQEIYYAGQRQSSVRFNEKGEEEAVLSTEEKRAQRKKRSENKFGGDF